MKNVVFLGSIYPDGYIEELLKQGSGIDFPSHNLQSALLEGSLQNIDSFSIITAVNKSKFPLVRPLFLPDKPSLFVSGKNRGVLIGGINFQIFDLVSQYFRFKKYLKQYLHPDEENLIIVYGLTSSRLLAIKAVSSKFKIQTIQIVPDLPEYMSEKQDKLYRFLKRIDAKLIKKGERIITGYVLLSPLMKDKLHVGEKPWIQMEGVYDVTASYPIQEKSKVKSILYTGKTDMRYGVLDLIDAFSMIDNPEYELWIRGDGNTNSEIALRAKRDKRIRIFPRMEKPELVALQKKATLLVNPNHSYEEFTKYFFPSKIIEYMGSGTPTVMCRLACLPVEYNDFVYFFDDESVDGMSRKLVEICEKSQAELDAFGAKARDFIIKRANGKNQARRILEMLE